MALVVLAVLYFQFSNTAAPPSEAGAWLSYALWAALPAGLLAAVVWLRRGHRRVADMVAFCRKAVLDNPSDKSLPVQRGDELGALEESLNELAHTLTSRLQDVTAEREKLQSILSCMMEGVIVLDTNGKVILVNQMAQAMFNLPADTSVRGMSTVEVSRHPGMQALILEVVEGDSGRNAFHRELTLGDDRWFAVNAARLEHSQQDLLGYVLVFHEVSELKRLEQIRVDFVANVSHEMRTPLTAIQGYAETLLHNPPGDPKMARQFLGVVARHSERLGRLIDDLLALSDLEMGNVNVRRERVATRPLLERVLELFRDQAGKKHIRIHADAITPDILGDEDRLQQLLINLVDNALKYTSEGGEVQVHAGLEPRSDGDHPPRLALTVSDTGCGIPEKDLPRLTERFYRVDKARSRELGGTGLGLAIVKHITQAHGGEMKIESRPGKGTRVSIYLRCASGTAPLPLQDTSEKSFVA
ncbi:MAG: ATP-binding protein [Deltaproteobacteria bacterium]|nr:ATP-binding protein [Deltaproteobacteria bacterium]